LKCHDEPRADFTCFMAKVFGQCRTEESRMRILCPLTCGYCEQCRDSSAYCAFFVDWWYCNTSGIIRQRCQKTCKQCWDKNSNPIIIIQTKPTNNQTTCFVCTLLLCWICRSWMSLTKMYPKSRIDERSCVGWWVGSRWKSIVYAVVPEN